MGIDRIEAEVLPEQKASIVKQLQAQGRILGIPIAAGVLYPFFVLLLSPIIAAAAMSFSSVSVIINALRLNWVKL